MFPWEKFITYRQIELPTLLDSGSCIIFSKKETRVLSTNSMLEREIYVQTLPLVLNCNPMGDHWKGWYDSKGNVAEVDVALLTREYFHVRKHCDLN